MDKLWMMENAFFFEGFAVTADSLQYIVRERRVIKESDNPEKIGKEMWGNEKYFPTLLGVFSYLSEMTCRKNIGNLNIAIKKIDSLRSMVSKITQL